MSSAEVEHRPRKKRRFFVDDPPTPPDITLPVDVPLQEANAFPDATHSTNTQERSPKHAHISSSQTDASTYVNGTDTARESNNGFNKELLESIIGKTVSYETAERLRDMAGSDIERAINIYFDGSWQTANVSRPVQRSDAHFLGPTPLQIVEQIHPNSPAKTLSAPNHTKKGLLRMPERRYVGAFGVGAWATRSGANLITHGEIVNIERTKSRPQTKIGRGGKVVQVSRMNASRQRADVIVRFTNKKGEEVGRLPKETATWVSSLIDQHVCHFEGHCVYTPDRIRINDTIYLQLRCYLLRRTFEAGGFIKPEESNRTTGIFEEKETTAEQDLRLRQVALVKLFGEINLLPSTLNETTEKHKRKGLLQAAEVAEQYEKSDDTKKSKVADNGTSTPPTDEEPEEGKELEQDQLDTLYKKAQSFDFNTPTREPADTFKMDLRKYQKQALHWMMKKEKDEKEQRQELSMHPLWEEYIWPAKDVDDKELPRVVNQDSFYVNPYSGELSLEFPVQEQHCLGGILADGMSS